MNRIGISLYLVAAIVWIACSDKILQFITHNRLTYYELDLLDRLISVAITVLFMLWGMKKWNKITQETRLSLVAKIVESSQESILITNEHGVIEWVNSAFTKITGYSFAEAVGNNTKLLKSGKHEANFYEDMWKRMQVYGKWEGEIWNKKKSGQIYPEWLTIQALRNERGKVTNYSAIFRDLTKEKQLLADLQLAGKIQKESLPSGFIRSDLTIETIYKAVSFVSGDLFDYVWIQDGVLSGYLLDVMGHGLATAIQASAIRVLFRKVVSEPMSLAEKMERINQESFSYFTEDSFCAAISFELDLKNGTLTVCSAGINSLIAVKNNQKSVIKIPGLFIGILPNTSYETMVLNISDQDQFFFMTDGMFDLLSHVDKLYSSNFNEYVAMLRNQLQEQGFDDASAVCINIHKIGSQYNKSR